MRNRFVFFFRRFRGQSSQIAGDAILDENGDDLLLEDSSLLLLER